MCVFHVTRISKNGMTTAVIWTDTKLTFGTRPRKNGIIIFWRWCILLAYIFGIWFQNNELWMYFYHPSTVVYQLTFMHWPRCAQRKLFVAHFRIRNFRSLFRPKLKSWLTFLWGWSHFRKIKKIAIFDEIKCYNREIIFRGYLRTIHKSYWLARFWLDEDLFLRVHSKYPLCRLDFIWWYAIKVITYAGFRSNGGWSYRTLKLFVIITNTHLNAD